MNRFARPLQIACRCAARAAAVLLRTGRVLVAAVVRADARAEAALRSWARPTTTRVVEVLRRLAAANCGDALSRHLPCRSRERTRDASLLDDRP
ncbi:hypothetical protein RMN57_35775 [Kitasatospora sp. CM 4170]|uniref:Secreted protein n=1 Tax=Kitasatospora aburaviensis TaxID=67265 RepID=A0ABW1EZ19_9ACTN|nr:hypothetical protein [Kitasatospora sp. CM 4170]WNM49682.1 hypothetical protein RMN57_35775 [Kitasatospora sp. CM 4170]